MTRDEKFKEILDKALMIFPVFKPGAKSEDSSIPRLSHLQFSTLLFIAHSPKKNGEVMNSISSFLGISKQQTTKLVDSLVELGLINRTLNPNSRREILITINPNGKFLLDAIKEKREIEFISRLKKLTNEEVDELYNHVISAYKLFEKAEY